MSGEEMGAGVLTGGKEGVRAEAREAVLSRVERRLELVDWASATADLDAQGWAILPTLLDPAEADLIASLYRRDAGFRKTVVMERHGFGRGAYKYFSYPLPELVQALRAAVYRRLAPIANDWRVRRGEPPDFPSDHPAYLARCRRAGQMHPTPLLLEYGAGDYNCLHRDLYGEEVFPLQMAILLDQAGDDFTGGEFVMTEQRPRMQSRVMVLPLRKGDAAIFAVAGRPVAGARGHYQVRLSHGVSRLWSGKRRTLGIIFHDAA